MAGTRGGPGRTAGTRGGAGRIAAMAIGLAVVLVLALADAARAGNYNVAQCGWGIGAELDPAAPRTEGVGAALHPGYCTAPLAGSPLGMEFALGLADDGEAGVARARWAAPPGTNFVGVAFTWSADLRRAVWQVAGIDDGAELHAVAIGTQSVAPYPVAVTLGAPAPAFEGRLECVLAGPLGCTRSSPSSMLLRDLTLTVNDPVPPTARLGGDLAAPGWHRGKAPLEIAGEDPAGGGLQQELATVDGTLVASAPVPCATVTVEGDVRAARLRPCPPTATRVFEVDTTALADGTHTLLGCADDFSGGLGCAPAVQLQVDNSPPGVEIAAAPEGQVTATVSDPSSGPAAGTIAVRRADSEGWTDLPTTLERGGAGTATLRTTLPDPDGTYVVRATASDAAGNEGAAQLRVAGGAAEAPRQGTGADDAGVDGPASRGGGRGGGGGAAPPGGGRGTAGIHKGGGAATRLTAFLAGADHKRSPRLTVDFGAAVVVRGRLIDRRGAGVARRPVVVLARPTAAAGGPPLRRRVLTDRAGDFTLRLPPGTSRTVLVAFHGGGRFLPAHGRPMALKVRAAVSLTAVPPRLRTGDSVTFSGAVRPGPARIPRRGKVVAIQYLDRESGAWRPALVVRTDTRGRFRDRYRFRYITGAARIRLRATALPEAGWPYAAGSSPPVTVEVHGG
jgi:hypothetical protein